MFLQVHTFQLLKIINYYYFKFSTVEQLLSRLRRGKRIMSKHNFGTKTMSIGQLNQSMSTGSFGQMLFWV